MKNSRLKEQESALRAGSTSICSCDLCTLQEKSMALRKERYLTNEKAYGKDFITVYCHFQKLSVDRIDKSLLTAVGLDWFGKEILMGVCFDCEPSKEVAVKQLLDKLHIKSIHFLVIDDMERIVNEQPIEDFNILTKTYPHIKIFNSLYSHIQYLGKHLPYSTRGVFERKILNCINHKSGEELLSCTHCNLILYANALNDIKLSEAFIEDVMRISNIEDASLHKAISGKFFEDIPYLYKHLEENILNSNAYLEVAYCFWLYETLPACRCNRFDKILLAMRKYDI